MAAVERFVVNVKGKANSWFGTLDGSGSYLNFS